MADNLAKAEIIEVDDKFDQPASPQKRTTVQFNPESLKVTFANQVAPSTGAGDQSGSGALQFVGAGTTKLALQLVYDVTQQLPRGSHETDDVRELTKEIVYFITPKPAKSDANKKLPPAVRFLWGSFKFDGVMDSLDETLELFSSSGKPLRSVLGLSITQQKISNEIAPVETPAGAMPSFSSPPGTAPLSPAPAGLSLQAIASLNGSMASWQDIASANGIENPRLLAPGQLINLNISVKGGLR